MYSAESYGAATVLYEQAIAACRGEAGDCTNPRLTPAYFFLGHSYEQLFVAAASGGDANIVFLTQAIANYKKASTIESDPKIKGLALAYLVSSYGPSRLNDPAQAEPILLRMIEMDPKETSSYFGLANIYEQSGDLERAEQMLNKARDVQPKESAVYMQLAGFYNRQGDFEKTMAMLHDRAEHEPSNPEAHYVIATYYWEKAYRDFTTPDTDKIKFVQRGPPGDRRGHPAEPELLRSADLQEPAAPRAGHSRKSCQRDDRRSCKRPTAFRARRRKFEGNSSAAD